MPNAPTPEPSSDTPKQLGRYQIVRTIGRGAMGLVFEGFDPNVGRRVAIKTILVQSLAPELVAEFENRFRTEARSAGRLQHPNIVSVYDADRDIDIAYLVMEYVKGRDLKQLIDEGAVFTLGDIRSIMRQLLAALDTAHRQNIIHRDIKPANMLMQEDGGLKLTDFGVARISDSGEATRTGGGLVGTLKYMSPEQVKGLPIDTRADLFSAGVVLYQLLTGRQPFRGDNDFALIRQIANDEPPAPSSLNPALTAEVDAVVARALAKEPAERYATARDFASDLRRVLQKAEGVAPIADADEQDAASPETFSDTRTPVSPQFVSRLAAAAADTTSGPVGDPSTSSVTAFNSLNSGFSDEATVVVQPAAAVPPAQVTTAPVVSSSSAAVPPAKTVRPVVLGAVAMVLLVGIAWGLLRSGSGETPDKALSPTSESAALGVPTGTSLPSNASAQFPSLQASASVPNTGTSSRSTVTKTVTASGVKRSATTTVAPSKVGEPSAPEPERAVPATSAPQQVPPAKATGPQGPASPSAACADRSWLTRSNCIFQQCETVTGFRNHPECVAQREEFRQREDRERNR